MCNSGNSRADLPYNCAGYFHRIWEYFKIETVVIHLHFNVLLVNFKSAVCEEPFLALPVL